MAILISMAVGIEIMPPTTAPPPTTLAINFIRPLPTVPAADAMISAGAISRALSAAPSGCGVGMLKKSE